MNDGQLPAGSGPECLTRHRTRRYRGTAVAGVVALAAVGTVGVAAGAAESSPASGTRLTASASSVFSASSASYLTTNAATVASTVDGGVVDIVSREKYAGAVAAGTGMVLTSAGEILTNNHVVDGATSIKVTVVSTGRSYTAKVVGTDPTQDVAVLQLSGASGLKTIPISSSTVAVGQSVTASGNAGGKGGTPSSVTGTVVALAQSITASDDGGGNAEQLTGLIETNAPIVAGDSGGPLASSGKVIGMDTAASASNEQAAYGGSSSSSGSSSAASQGYAIPIATALRIAQEIESGQASSTIHIGVHGFLGVELSSSTATQGGGSQSSGSSFGGSSYGGGSFGGSYGGFGGYSGFGGGYSSDGSSGTSAATVSGVAVTGVVTGSAAEAAGLRAGDVITSVDGHSIGSATALDSLMATTKAGQKITVAWTGSSGQTHTGSAVLDTAPVD